MRRSSISTRRASLHADSKPKPKIRLDESIRVVSKYKLIGEKKKNESKVILNQTSIRPNVEFVNAAIPVKKNISIKLEQPPTIVTLRRKLQSHRSSAADASKDAKPIISKGHRGSVDISSKVRGISPCTSQKTQINSHNTPKSTQHQAQVHKKLSMSKLFGSAIKVEIEKRASRASQRGRPNIGSSRGVSGGSAERPVKELNSSTRGKSRENNDKVINVSIHHNFNNVCYAPIYIKQQYKMEADKRLHKKTNSQANKKDYTQMNQDSIDSNDRLSETRVEHRNIDPLTMEREKLAQHNRIWFKNNDEVPRTTLEYYTFLKLIGKGAFGKVTLGIHKLTGKSVAIKTIEKKYMKDEFSRRKVFQEVYILKKIRHANVIRLLEVFEDPNHMLIVMEYAAGGDLLKYVRTKGPLPEPEAREIFRQIVYGLGHIHARSVIHRDVKLDNILLDKSGGVKICDFGVSKIIAKQDIIKEQCGTPAYIAPEVISNEGYCGFYIDHWSLGVLLYAMLCASVPFKAKNMQELLEVILSTEVTFPVKISENAQNLITSLLRIPPRERLSIPEILNHPWMKDESMDDSCNSSTVYVNSKDCVEDPDAVPSINMVNMSNLFFREIGEEKLSYNDYCAIGNDMYTYQIDEGALKTMEGFGYPRKVVIDGLQKGELNHATATYNLLVLP